MQINPDFNASAYTIKSYDTGEITMFLPVTEQEITNQTADSHTPIVKTRTFNQSFIVMPDKLKDDWRPSAANKLTAEDFETILEMQPELVILGTGKISQFPDAKDMLILQKNGIGVEVMGTAAACRTYNFLISDGRNAAAALFMIEQ